MSSVNRQKEQLNKSEKKNNTKGEGFIIYRYLDINGNFIIFMIVYKYSSTFLWKNLTPSIIHSIFTILFWH